LVWSADVRLLVTEDGLYEMMVVGGPKGHANVKEGDVKMESDKLLDRDAMISEPNVVGA